MCKYNIFSVEINMTSELAAEKKNSILPDYYFLFSDTCEIHTYKFYMYVTEKNMYFRSIKILLSVLNVKCNLFADTLAKKALSTNSIFLFVPYNLECILCGLECHFGV